MLMRFSLILCCAAFLGACATTQPSASSTAKTANLPISKLAPGKCGLYGWSTDETREFTFYADEKTARYASLDGPEDLTATSPFPSTKYIDSSGKDVALRLGQGEVMIGGMRYPSARIVTLTAEGWERIHPVAIVRSCQPK